MKDKRAFKKKQKRRMERTAAHEAEKREFVEGIKAYAECKKNKKSKKYDRNLAWKLKRQLESETRVKSFMSCMIATIYHLNKDCGWSYNRLQEYASKCSAILTAVGNGDRTIDKLEEELKFDAGLDIHAMLDGYIPFGGKIQSEDKKNRNALVLSELGSSMVMTLYELYNNPKWPWKKVRMNRIAAAVKETVIDALENDRMEEIISELENKIGVRIDFNGAKDTRS